MSTSSTTPSRSAFATSSCLMAEGLWAGNSIDRVYGERNNSSGWRSYRCIETVWWQNSNISIHQRLVTWTCESVMLRPSFPDYYDDDMISLV
jgi:hypothetical protein